jgi:REP element-mobilizing transposase RayT
VIETRERWRFRLPHWEVIGKVHFVTIRCAGSLPAEALPRVREIHAALQEIEPSSPQFAALQRKYFLLCERYLDAGHGFCPFREKPVGEFTTASLAALLEIGGWEARHFVLMPNHVHLLLAPTTDAGTLRAAVRGWKWQVATGANRLLGRSGSFWQSDWFDRWARSEAEEERMRDYILQNPVKAGLVERWADYPWVR